MRTLPRDRKWPLRRRLVRGAVVLSAVLAPTGFCLHLYAFGRLLRHEHLRFMHFLWDFGLGCVGFACLVYAIAALYTLHRASRKSRSFWGDGRTFWLGLGGPIGLIEAVFSDDDLWEDRP